MQGMDVGYDLIEVMACRAAASARGAPVPEKIDTLQKRQETLVSIDKVSKYRKSQENPDILRLYEDFYDTANSKLAHHLLHTHYHAFRNEKSSEKGMRKRADSAFVTHEFTICMCESCVAKGAKELYNQLTQTIRDLKMDSFIEVKTIRLKENHASAGFYVT